MERKWKEMQKAKNKKRAKCLNEIISIHTHSQGGTARTTLNTVISIINNNSSYWESVLSRKNTDPLFTYLHTFEDLKFSNILGSNPMLHNAVYNKGRTQKAHSFE